VVRLSAEGFAALPPGLQSPDVAVIGYGSLMSGLGLQPFGRLRVRGAARVSLSNARRGFGKFSQHGDRFAMVLEPLRIDEPLYAQTLAADAPASGTPEGILFSVRPNDLARLSDREGYSSGAMQRLRQEAATAGQELALFLWLHLEAAGFATSVFRERLFKLIGYTSPHYVPHPVRLDRGQFAVTFLAPGSEGSGAASIVPVRVRTGTTELMTACETWRRKPNRTQLAYFAACLLGGVHGIGLHDLLPPLADDAPLSARLRDTLRREQQQELARFLDMTGLDHSAYWQQFGPPTHGVQRSGLEDFMSARGDRHSALG
jgi:cation transport regulator ChaC